jgi:tetratricopeptide (TPR) repeat protein/CHAT domain-containing protein
MSHPVSTFELVLQGRGAPNRFVAWVPDGEGGKAAEHPFEWRVDSVRIAMDLSALKKAAVSGRPPENDLHVTFGQELFKAVFAGPVGDLWNSRSRPRRQVLRLVVRVDPKSARPLLNVPWEYLHDGKDFLSLQWRTPISRLPWDLLADPLPALTEPLRLLVLIAAPLGLSQNMVLHTAREEDLILAATAAARTAGHLQVEFTPSGSPEALEEALREFDPHLLHLTGHGIFDESKDTGSLLMETPDGCERPVFNADFAKLIERRGKSLRLVFLSACQSAVSPQNEGYADLAPRLLEAGIPAVVAMQFSVLNQSAMDLGSVFYKGLADGDPVDAALTEARGRLAEEGVNGVDFAVPVLFLSDPGCLRVDPTAFRPSEKSETPLDLTGVTLAQSFVGRSAELRLLQTNLDPDHGSWRAAIIYGLGGMGKTVLAARLAQRMAFRLDGVKSIRMSPVTTARDVIDQLAAFLQIRQVQFGHPGIQTLIASKDQSLPLESKADLLCQILRDLRLLIILDNCEDIFPQGKNVSRAEGGAGSDPDLLRLIALLLEGVERPSRFLFTSRVDFSPLEAGRLSNAIGSVSLSEMQFRDAVYLMETSPPLNTLPVAAVSNVLSAEPRPRPLTKRELYERLGGHPYTLNLFSEHARRFSLEEVLAGLPGVRKELLEFTLLERAVGFLPERAAFLLKKAAVYEEAIPLEGLAFLLGNEQDAMPSVEAEVTALLSWGLLTQPPGTSQYKVHSLVRDWGWSQWKEEERLDLLNRAAEYWLGVGRDSAGLEPELNARHYFFRAGKFEQANRVVQLVYSHFSRWGHFELLLRLLNESIGTIKGLDRAVALAERATVYQALGDYEAARRGYEEVLPEFEARSEKRLIAVTLHQFGILDTEQGNYASARNYFEKSLSLRYEVGDVLGSAMNLQLLGVLDQLDGDCESARRHYEESLEIKKNFDDEQGIAKSLHQLGRLHHMQGEYGLARDFYEKSLALKLKLRDMSGIAASVHQLGILHQVQGNHREALACYERSLAIGRKLGDKSGIATTLGQIGNLYARQKDYRSAKRYFEQSLEIFNQLGSPDRKIAIHNLNQAQKLMEEQASDETGEG